MFNGMFFEDYQAGQKEVTDPLNISERELDMFCVATGAYFPTDNRGNVHLDAEFAAKLGLKDRVVPGLQLLSLLSRLGHMAGIWDNAGLFLGMNRVRFMAPVYPGDSIYAEVTVLDKKDKEKWGAVTFSFVLKNTDDIVVCSMEPVIQYQKKPSN